MLTIDIKKLSFRIRQVWFSDRLYDVRGYDAVMFYSCREKLEKAGFKCSEYKTLTIDLTKSLSEIERNVRRSVMRAIRQAKEYGVVVRMNSGYEEFCQINRSFRKKKGLTTLFDRDASSLKKCGTLFVAEIDGEIVSGHYYLEDENVIRWLYAASKRLEVDAAKASMIGKANKLLVWTAIEYAKNKGLKEYDFGGYWGSTEKEKGGVDNFKLSFGGQVVTRYNYEKAISRRYRLAKGICSKIKLFR